MGGSVQKLFSNIFGIISKPFLLPKFIQHVIQTPKYRITLYFNEMFSIEKKNHQSKNIFIPTTMHDLVLYFYGDSPDVKQNLQHLSELMVPANFVTVILHNSQSQHTLFKKKRNEFTISL